MASYNNKHWLLAHIRNSFISTDDTGMCETVMLSEDLPSQYAMCYKNQHQTQPQSNSRPPEEYYFYPGLEQSDDEELDPLAQSYDVQMDQDVGFHRQRSNTAQKLEKMNLARKRASKIKIIKCDEMIPIVTDTEKSLLFKKKEIMLNGVKISLLSDQLTRWPKQPQNKFFQYARFDGTAHLNTLTKTIKIFLTMLPESQRNYPMQVCVTSTAKIQEFIGLVCYKCSIVNPETPLLSVQNYGLYITEEDGEIDLDFPPLDIREACSKFCFSHLALVERKSADLRLDTRTMSMTSEVNSIQESVLQEMCSSSMQQTEDLARMLGHTTMMEAPTYRSYRLQILTKGLFKTEIQLGISGEKLEIDPVQQQNTKFWARQKAISHSMYSVAWCDIIEETSSRATIRIVYSHSHNQNNTDSQKASPIQTSISFRHYDFITDVSTAREIVEKINNIIDVRSSASRREYLTK